MDAFFINNSCLDEDRNLKMVHMCLSRQEGSNDTQQDLLDPNRGLDLRLNFKVTFRGHVIYQSKRLDETNTMVPISFLWLKYIKSYLQKSIFPKKPF